VSSRTRLARETARTQQPLADHVGTVSRYPWPEGAGWRFVAMLYDEHTAYYEWERWITEIVRDEG
jgi:hypothetical protein